jgi:hypothetical protein
MTDQNHEDDVMDRSDTTRVSGDHEIHDADLDDMNAAWDRIKADQVFLDPPIVLLVLLLLL